MATINVAAVDGNAIPFVMKGTDRGAGTADSTAGKVITLHHHDDLLKTDWDKLNNVGLTVNYSTGVISTLGDNVVISSPGGTNYLSLSWLIISNESAVNTTVIWKSGTTSIGRIFIPANSSSDLVLPAHAPINCAANTSFTINLSAANSTSYTIAYVIKS